MITWMLNQPENEEHTSELVLEVMRKAEEGFADAAASGSPHAEEWARMWLEGMTALRERRPDLAAELEGEE